MFRYQFETTPKMGKWLGKHNKFLKNHRWYQFFFSWLFTFLGEGSLSKSEIQELTNWLSATLSPKANRVTVTNKLASHPCVVTVEEMGAARHFVKTQFQQIPESQRYQILQPQLEINPRWCFDHALIDLIFPH